MKFHPGRWLLIIMILALLPACSKPKSSAGSGKLKVVTTLFPLYDFARAVGGESVEVSLLLPPGVEPHSFEPRPEDMLTVAKADIFIYTNREMEPWAEKLVSGVTRAGKPVRIEAGEGAHYLSAATQADHNHGGDRHKEGAKDPHIWLDIGNSMQMVDNIAKALTSQAPLKREQFTANATAYRQRLKALDDRFRQELSNCGSREFIHGGHYAFAYLANRYNLQYISAYGVSADSEPSPRKMMELIDTIRRHKLNSVFYEELLSPAVARSVAEETGASLLKLHGIHNLTRQEFEGGATYPGLMEQNLAALRKGLECR